MLHHHAAAFVRVEGDDKGRAQFLLADILRPDDLRAKHIMHSLH